jgi:hypothetical protein
MDLGPRVNPHPSLLDRGGGRKKERERERERNQKAAKNEERFGDKIQEILNFAA